MSRRRGCRSARGAVPVAEGRLVYHLWAVKPIMGVDPDKRDHDDEPWGDDLIAQMAMNSWLR